MRCGPRGGACRKHHTRSYSCTRFVSLYSMQHVVQRSWSHWRRSYSPLLPHRCELQHPPGPRQLPGHRLSPSSLPLRIGFLSSGTTELLLEDFRQGLGELGYVEGQNIVDRGAVCGGAG